MSDVFGVAGIFLLLGVLLGVTIGLFAAREVVMKQAYDRGYAVQCLGKGGYYWECEE